MRLPDQLCVQLYSTATIPGGLADILVAIDVTVGGRYYYGDLVGLTDRNGRVCIPGAQLDAQFRAEQQASPMDFKLPLSACDDTVVVRVDGGGAFQTAQSAALGSRLRAGLREQWSRARNSGIRSCQAGVDTTSGPPAAIRLEVVAAAKVAT